MDYNITNDAFFLVLVWFSIQNLLAQADRRADEQLQDHANHDDEHDVDGDTVDDVVIGSEKCA